MKVHDDVIKGIRQRFKRLNDAQKVLRLDMDTNVFYKAMRGESVSKRNANAINIAWQTHTAFSLSRDIIEKSIEKAIESTGENMSAADYVAELKLHDSIKPFK